MKNVGRIVKLLRKEHDRLARQIKGIDAALEAFGTAYEKSNRDRRISPAGRARIAAAQRARWAKSRTKANQTQKVVANPKKRTLSTTARRKIAAAQRARWAKVKAAKK